MTASARKWPVVSNLWSDVELLWYGATGVPSAGQPSAKNPRAGVNNLRYGLADTCVD